MRLILYHKVELLYSVPELKKNWNRNRKQNCSCIYVVKLNTALSIKSVKIKFGNLNEKMI